MLNALFFLLGLFCGSLGLCIGIIIAMKIKEKKNQCKNSALKK